MRDVGEEAGDRRGIDDRAAAALEQFRNRPLRGAEHAGEAQLDRVGPHRLVDVADEGEPAPARRQRGLAERIVVQDVEAAEGLDGAADHRVDARRLRRIGRDGDRGAPRARDLAGDSLRLRLVDVGHGDLGAARREAHRRGPPDSRSRARDQRHLAVEPHRGLRATSIPPVGAPI